MDSLITPLKLFLPVSGKTKLLNVPTINFIMVSLDVAAGIVTIS